MGNQNSMKVKEKKFSLFLSFSLTKSIASTELGNKIKNLGLDLLLQKAGRFIKQAARY
jgi:hypothetical protein